MFAIPEYIIYIHMYNFISTLVLILMYKGFLCYKTIPVRYSTNFGKETKNVSLCSFKHFPSHSPLHPYPGAAPARPNSPPGSTTSQRFAIQHSRRYFRNTQKNITHLCMCCVQRCSNIPHSTWKLARFESIYI